MTRTYKPLTGAGCGGLLALSLLLIGPSPAAAASWHVIWGTGVADRSSATFVDWNSSQTAPTPMFGSGYNASGHFRRSVGAVFGVGRELLPGLAWEATVSWHPSADFAGNANFPRAGNSQPAQATLRSQTGLLSVQIEPLALLGVKTGRVVPELGLGGGVAFNRIDRLVMSFPELKRPHIFTTPGGRSACTAWTAFAGVRFRFARRLGLALRYRFLDLGHADTDPGDGILHRPAENQTLVIPINGTTVRCRRHGLELTVRWSL